MNNSLKNLDTEPWYKQFWPWFLMSLPATVVVACIFTIIVAVRSPLSLVDADYYKEGLKINDNLATRELALKMGIEATVKIENSYIQVDLSGDQIQQQSLNLSFIHTTDSDLDRRYELEQVGLRRFELNIDSTDSFINSRYLIRIEGLLYGTEPRLDRWLIESEPQLIINGLQPTQIRLSADLSKNQ